MAKRGNDAKVARRAADQARLAAGNIDSARTLYLKAVADPSGDARIALCSAADMLLERAFNLANQSAHTLTCLCVRGTR